MKNRIMAGALALLLCLSIIGVAGAAGAQTAFSDVTDTDTAEAVAVLSSLGIVSGYSDGGYHPAATLTRAQFSVLAILAEGHGDSVQNSAYRTLFSDLPATHWAAPYVNLAHEETLVSGYGNGTFGPNDSVTMGQAVTVVLHLLGYTTDDIGPFWPEDYMQKANTLGLTDGISKFSGQALTRGDAALLLYQMLKSQMKEGKNFATNLAATSIDNAVVLSNNTEADDGTLHTAQIYNPQSGITYYKQNTALSDGLLARRGTLLLNKSGEVAGFLPDDNIYKTISLTKVAADKLTDASGKIYTVSSRTALVMDDSVTTYGDGWYDLDGRSSVTAFYSASGSIDLLVASQAVKYSGTALTGYYESASPNTSNPTSITLLGQTFEVDDSALTSLSQFKVGDRMTVVLNGGGDVTYACSTSERTAQMVGLVTSSGSTCQVELFNGLTVSGTLSSGSAAVGNLVRVTSSGIGKVSLSQISTGFISGSLNVSAKTMGSVALADDVVLYDRVGNGTAVKVTLDDILTATVSSSYIAYTGTDTDGKVDVIVLKDVTGNAYTYGILYTSTKSQGSGDMAVTNTTVSVENSAGTTPDYIIGSSVSSGSVGGISATSAGKVAGVATLSKVADVSRTAFDGSDAVVIDNVRVPISDDVQVYNSDTAQWITLSAAKAYGASFTIYYSGSIGSDSQVRVIFTD